MTQPAISVRNLSKCYKLGTIGRHTLVDEAQYLWHKIRGKDPRQHFSKIGHTATEARKVEAEEEGNKEFWALRDVSFDVQPGEVIGVIGRNGAGKSTLLKILTRITEPTSGEAIINGRVASLLEVGTGFHPELTGRENVYMNGTILGMKRREIAAKFDEIVAFSELEKFIDTPVKRYSSGMYVRLAFAVAAHLDPEILLVDEVLAVGDAGFQKKCLGKMSDVAKEGRTILFVSHNMAAVQQLCNAGMVLGMGNVVNFGPIGGAVEHYLENIVNQERSEPLAKRKQRQGKGWLRFTHVELINEAGRQVAQAISGNELRMRMHYVSEKVFDMARLQIAFNLKNPQGLVLANVNAEDSNCSEQPVHREGWFECRCPDFPLRQGLYDCALFCSVNGEIVDWVDNGYRLEVIDGNFHDSGRLINRNQGDFLIHNQWTSHAVHREAAHTEGNTKC